MNWSKLKLGLRCLTLGTFLVVSVLSLTAYRNEIRSVSQMPTTVEVGGNVWKNTKPQIVYSPERAALREDRQREATSLLVLRVGVSISVCSCAFVATFIGKKDYGAG